MSKLFRPFKEGFTGVFRHLAMSLSSASAVMITLSLVAVFAVMSANINQITRNIEQSVEIKVQVDYAYEANDQVQTIQSEIQQIPGVLSVTFSSKDEELDALIESWGEDGYLYEEFRGEENPLHMAFLVQAVDGTYVERIANTINQTIEGVYRVSYGGPATVSLLRIVEAVRNVGYLFSVALGLLAVFLIANTIQLTINSRQREISIMRAVGATNNFIRAPFMVEGMLIGIIGAIVPVIVSAVGYHYLYKSLGGVIFTQMFPMAPTWPLMGNISLLLVGIGALVGLVGSFISVTRHLRFTR